MKVGTDGVLLGAWVNVSGASGILDIGTGTGLISLMLAQRSNALIDAVEIDTPSAGQASENVANSVWSDRIRIFNTSFRDFYHSSENSYDLIISNPPFFSRSLKAPDPARSTARHDDGLSRADLFKGVAKMLAKNGVFALILPYNINIETISLAKENNLFPARILKVKPSPGKNYHRVLLEFSAVNSEPAEEEMTIETGTRHQYSEEYTRLTKDFYL